MRALLSIAAAAVLLSSCAQPTPPVEGLEPTPLSGFVGRRKQLPLPAEKADVAVVFVGGFSEQVLLHFRQVYEQMPPLPCEGRQLRAYYAWDSGTGNLLFHSTWKLQRDLRTFLQLNPQADVVLLGHSYGGSAIMDALRQLGDVPHSGKVLVVTLDPVSRRERSKPRERAQMVDYWVNAYCSPYRNVRDVAAWLGGPWGHCPQADENLAYSGRQRDEDGDRFAHVYPEPLLMEKAPGAEKSPHELLLEACKRFKIGRK